MEAPIRFPVWLWFGCLLCTLVSHPALAQTGSDQRLVVKDLAFDGNEAIDDLTLATSIATTRSSCPLIIGCNLGLGEKRYFDEREFRRDVLRIRGLYTQSGFRGVQVDTLVRRGDGEVRIRFRIFEGEPVRVTALEVSGTEGIVAPVRLARDLPLQPGDPFNRFLLQASADTIRVALENRGYPFAQVFRNFDENREARTARVSFDVDPGPRATVDSISVDGAQAISDGVVRRTMAVRDGRLYRRRELLESQRDLYAMDVFSYVNVSLADTLPDHPDDSLVRVHVQVSEGALQRVRFGVGYGSIDCLRALGGWTSRNFMGGARRLDVTARISKLGAGDPAALGLERSICFGIPGDEDPERLKLNYTLSASLREPFLFNRRTSVTLSLTAERRSEISAFVRTEVGGDLAITRLVGSVPLTLTYALTSGRTDAGLATFCTFLNVCREEDTRVFTERTIQSTLSLRALVDRRDSPLDPTRGWMAQGEGRWASDAIGSDSLAQFTRVVGEVAAYHRMGRRTVLAWRVRGGSIVPPSLRASGQDLQFVPPAERFYGGGPNSVRGFGQNQLGPTVYVDVPVEAVDEDDDGVTDGFTRDTVPSPTGGNQLFFANVELRFPLPGFGGRLHGALFLDAGRVFERDEELVDFSEIRFTPGFGTRVSSPLGPIRLDVAYNGYAPAVGPLFRRETPDDPVLELVNPTLRLPRGHGLFNRLRFHFSIGQAF